MTNLKERPVKRRTVAALDGSHGSDRGRRLVAALFHDTQGDWLTIRPEGTRRAEIISLFDVYRFAIRCRVNSATLKKARAAKERKAIRLAAARQRNAEKRLFRKDGAR